MTIRWKIISGFIFIIVVTFLALALVTINYVRSTYVKEVQSRVLLEMKSAQDIYNDQVAQVADFLHAASVRRNQDKTLQEEFDLGLEEVFSNIFWQSNFDILLICDTGGNVIYRAHNPSFQGDNISSIPVIKAVLDKWETISGTIVIDSAILVKESPDLAFIAQIKNPGSDRENRPVVNGDGVFIVSAVPVTSIQNERKLGVLIGGTLVNNNDLLLSSISNKIFQDQNTEDMETGVVTIFYKDMRIATKVRSDDGGIATGTKMETQIYDQIMSGKQWKDRALVLNEWYITVYSPLTDTEGIIIGSLAVGLKEAPFIKSQNTIIWFFIVGLGIAAFAGLVFLFFYLKSLMKPVDRIIQVSKRIMRGDLKARCRYESSGEIGILCKTFDQMADSIEKHEMEMKEETRKQILMSEKQASIGRLSAGVAHEINNPLTGILTFAHFLKDRYTDDEKYQDDINVIIHETTRIREIIRGLLDFARQSPAVKSPVNMNDVIVQLLKLIRTQKEFKSIKIIEKLDIDLPEVNADKNQLQQVMLNLILNACEAITDQGFIAISTAREENMIRIEITDSGCGIKEEDKDKIFDPFFTTKPVGKGTGLGLSVSYGIIEQHSGSIKFESTEGKGTTFIIRLPLNKDKSSRG